ncbi:hypothetical protein CPC08DRAFT_710652 [Agrocybe pediades]|nr:hypothetical protein CPC08DRAFT_710652 [Agrocybe pediades]
MPRQDSMAALVLTEATTTVFTVLVLNRCTCFFVVILHILNQPVGDQHCRYSLFLLPRNILEVRYRCSRKHLHTVVRSVSSTFAATTDHEDIVSEHCTSLRLIP